MYSDQNYSQQLGIPNVFVLRIVHLLTVSTYSNIDSSEREYLS